jgi:hypothetical protein
MAHPPGFLRQDIARSPHGLKTGHYRLVMSRRDGEWNHPALDTNY